MGSKASAYTEPLVGHPSLTPRATKTAADATEPLKETPATNQCALHRMYKNRRALRQGNVSSPRTVLQGSCEAPAV